MLAAGNIKFAPDIPKRALDAAAKLGLGSYEHIALLMPGNPLGLARDDILLEQSNSTRTALLYANMGSSSLCSIDVGGSFGRDLSAQGEPAMIAFAIDWLDENVGSELAKAGTIQRHPLERIAYGRRDVGGASSAQPFRKILSEPVGSIYFAGEATRNACGAVDGAWAASAPPTLRCGGSPCARACKAGTGGEAATCWRAACGPAGDVGQLMGRPGTRPKALISWSSGKDSAFSLHEVRRAGAFDVVGALTTVTETFERVSIHGVRQEVLRAQCEAAGLPQRIVPIPYPCPNEIYEARMGEAVASAVREGITHMIFGDLFLADIRAYREQGLDGTGISRCFRCGSARRRHWRTP